MKAGITLSDLNPTQSDIVPGDIDIPDPKKLNLNALTAFFNQPKKYEFRQFLKPDTWFDIDNSLVIDTETFNLNSNVRMIQVYDVAARHVTVYLWGRSLDTDRIRQDLEQHDITLDLKEHATEQETIADLFKLIYEKRKPLVGHNLAQFDLGILNMKKSQYGIGDTKFYNYNVGSGMTNRKIYFNYTYYENEEWSPRIPIIDTLYMAFGLDLRKTKLADLSKKSPYPKKEVDYRVFENSELDYDAVMYAIYDVLSIPYVYQDLREIIELPTSKLKVESKPSQLLNEHIWMKGSGALAESFLNQLLGRVDPHTPDYLSKYLGGLTRSWINREIFTSDKDEVIRELDFTSAYVFSIAKQKVFDILAGSCEYFENVMDQADIKQVYDDLIYSSVLDIKAREKLKVLVEIERDKNDPNRGKNKGHKFGIGWVRSFDKDNRIQEIQHDFAMVVVKRGQTIRLTKTEYEMNKAQNPDFEHHTILQRIVDGMRATDDTKTREYLEMYVQRRDLKRDGNPAEAGLKKLILSAYGKVAQNTGPWFNLACASSITGFARYQLFSTILYARYINCRVIQSDTDSLYLKGRLDLIKKIQDYADKINPLTREYGEPNLKDEGEDIRVFWGQKRKRYTKVLGFWECDNCDKTNSGVDDTCSCGSPRSDRIYNEVHITGQNGFKDIAWKDILFRLCVLTHPLDPDTGRYEIEYLDDLIQEECFEPEPKIDIDLFEDFCRRIYRDHLGKSIGDILPVKSTAQISLMVRIKLNTKTAYGNGYSYQKFIDAWAGQVNKDISNAHISGRQDKNKKIRNAIQIIEDYDNLITLIDHQKSDISKIEKELKGIEKGKTSTWYKFLELLLQHYTDPDSFGESIFDTGDHVGFRYYFKKLNAYLNGFKDFALRKDYSSDTSDFYLHLFEYLKDYLDGPDHLIQIINTISPQSLDLDFNDNVIQGMYIDLDQKFESLKALQLRQKEIKPTYQKAKRVLDGIGSRPYVGLFFDANRQYGFTEPEHPDFSLKYDIYRLKQDYSPVITADSYNALLDREIKVDSIYLKARTGLAINDHTIPNKADKKRITNAIFNLPKRPGKVSDKHYPPWNRPFIIKTRVSQDLNDQGCYDIQAMSKKDDQALLEKDPKHNVYHNSAMLITGIGRIESSVKINKVGLFCENRTIFDIYKFFDRVGRSFQIYLEQLLKEQGIILEAPRYTISKQVDVCQPTDKEYHRRFFMSCYDAPVPTHMTGKFMMMDLTDYLSITCYDKKESATWKLNNEVLRDFEQEYFEMESKEEYRSEIKFELSRNIYETISYAYMLSMIQQESMLRFVEDYANIFKKKNPVMELDNKTLADCVFSHSKCLILFNSTILVRSEIIMQVFNERVNQPESQLTKKLLGLLEARVINTAKPPPPMDHTRQKHQDILVSEIEEVSRMRWSIKQEYVRERLYDIDAIKMLFN
jgi:hypothetical protein